MPVSVLPCWPGSKKGKNKKGVDIEAGPPASLTILNEVDKAARRSIASARFSLITQFIEKHPFEANKVLESILVLLPAKEVLKLRFVCKRWNFVACNVLRRKTEGTIILQRGLPYYTRWMNKSLETLDKEREGHPWTTEGSSPANIYSVKVGRLFLKIDDMEDVYAPEFFKTVGPSVSNLVMTLEGSSLSTFLTHLHRLENCAQLSLNLFQEDGDTSATSDGGSGRNNFLSKKKKRKATSIKIFVQHDYDKSVGELYQLETLESLVLSCEPEWRSGEAFLIEKLLGMCPNLRNLNLSKWPFPLRASTFKKCDFPELKFLCLKSLDEAGCSALAKKVPKNLKTIEFDLSSDISQESFNSFLEGVAPTLEYMEIKSTFNPTLAFKLPAVMKELVTIRLLTWMGPIMLDSIIANGPCLQKLQLSHVSPSEILTPFLKDQTVKQGMALRYLAVNFGNGTHSIKAVFKALKTFVWAFPGVNTFMMKKVADKSLEIICEGWPHLEALRITTSFSLSDSGITGIPASQLQKINKMGYRLTCGSFVPFPVNDGDPSGRADCSGARVVPNVTSLKSLKDLRIESEQGGSSWTLTNLSLHLALNEMRGLKSLRLTCPEIGPHWCLRCIADSLPYLSNLTIMDRAISHDRYNETELQHLLRKLPKLNLTFVEPDPNSARRGSTK